MTDESIFKIKVGSSAESEYRKELSEILRPSICFWLL